MIKILYKMIKILHEKMVNAIYLYWFHKDTPEKNESLNGVSNESWINTNKFFLVVGYSVGIGFGFYKFIS